MGPNFCRKVFVQLLPSQLSCRTVFVQPIIGFDVFCILFSFFVSRLGHGYFASPLCRIGAGRRGKSRKLTGNLSLVFWRKPPPFWRGASCGGPRGCGAGAWFGSRGSGGGSTGGQGPWIGSRLHGSFCRTGNSLGGVYGWEV